jgi:hypothetical protein
MTRAAVSIASISLKAQKEKQVEYIRFLHFAKGSADDCARKFKLPSKSAFTKTSRPQRSLPN